MPVTPSKTVLPSQLQPFPEPIPACALEMLPAIMKCPPPTPSLTSLAL